MVKFKRAPTHGSPLNGITIRQPGGRNGVEGIDGRDRFVDQFKPTDREAPVPELVETGATQRHTTAALEADVDVTGGQGNRMNAIVVNC